MSGKGGFNVSHSTHITICINVQEQTMILCCAGPNVPAALLSGNLALKAVTTTIVFPNTQEMQSANVIPKAVCLSMQVHTVGLPMNVRGQRKHKHSENNKKQLSSELLALITGVPL